MYIYGLKKIQTKSSLQLLAQNSKEHHLKQSATDLVATAVDDT